MSISNGVILPVGVPTKTVINCVDRLSKLPVINIKIAYGYWQPEVKIFTTGTEWPISEGLLKRHPIRRSESGSAQRRNLASGFGK